LNKLLTPRRVGAFTGLAFIIMFYVSGTIEGSSPKLTSTAAKITSFYISHHSKVPDR